MHATSRFEHQQHSIDNNILQTLTTCHVTLAITCFNVKHGVAVHTYIGNVILIQVHKTLTLSKT